MRLLSVGFVALLAQATTTSATLARQEPWRDPSPHETHSVTVDSNVRLEVLDWGGSGPALVLLGCYLTGHVYDDFAPKLTSRFRVYAITRRGIGTSDKPPNGYAVERSVEDVREVLDALQAPRAVLLGTSCAGQVLTLFASQHPDRLMALIYLDGASDPTDVEHDPPLPDPATLPRPVRPLGLADGRSIAAFQASQRQNTGLAFPESEVRQQFTLNADGSLGPSLLSLDIRRAITIDARMKPNYAGIRVPVLALYQSEGSFEEVAAGYDIRSEEQRAALRQRYLATKAMYERWQQELREKVPQARIVVLPGAKLFMFLSNEADVLREIGASSRSLKP
jgi:non-heme chloroperoxidase